MKQLDREKTNEIGGGLDARQFDTQVAPEPTTSDPLVVIDYNPPQQPQ